MLLAAQIMATSMLPAGIPDGGSVYVKGGLPINPTVPMPSPTQVRFTGQGPTVAAILRSVVFGDGQFVGVDEQRAFEQFGKKLKAINEVGILAKTQAWDQIESLAEAFTQGRQAPPGLAAPPTFVVAPPPGGEDRILYTFGQLAAMRLAQARKFKGEAAADQLAQIYSSLPVFW
jgi:hypothetical protein